MNDTDDILTSAPSAPDDDYWLEQGRKLHGESLAAVRTAAENLLKGLTALQGLYLAILGFSKYVPETIGTVEKFLFVVPLLLWMIATYHAVQVQMTESREINLHAPAEIRDWLNELARGKQRSLQTALWWFFAGLAAAATMSVLRVKVIA
jgi:hypothetical protein